MLVLLMMVMRHSQLVQPSHMMMMSLMNVLGIQLLIPARKRKRVFHRLLLLAVISNTRDRQTMLAAPSRSRRRLRSSQWGRRGVRSAE